MTDTLDRSLHAWQDDTPGHPLLTRHAEPPSIETRVSKVIARPLPEVFQHFWGSEPRLRLELHRDHVKGYSIHRETPDSLEYEFVFEAYGARNWGRAVEVAHRPHRIDVEVKEGPIAGQTVTTLFREVPGGTEVVQVNRVWPGDADTMVRLLGGKIRSRLAALAGVHLEQHRHDLEGLGRFQDRFSAEHQQRLATRTTGPILDFLKTTRAIALPTVVLPLLAAAALAAQQGTFGPVALALTLAGGGAALLGANLLNDVYDFRHGADQAARTVPGQIETGSGAFVEGRWSLRKGWLVLLALFATAALCGLALAWLATPLVLLFAGAGAAIAYAYVGPPFPLAYKGRGIGEALIFVAFGILPVLGGVLAHGGAITPLVWWAGAVFGLTSTLVLYHHHFLHWEADRAAGKLSPVALLGPGLGAWAGMGLVLATSAAILLPFFLDWDLHWALALPALGPLVALGPQARVAGGAHDPLARTRLASAAFGAMLLTGIGMVVALWLA
jgi:1,4-dihydroxy-2-naphthoate polyprenyltransferase